ncbi:putative uncharacterized protein [Waddlia chondrophila 2032/99]|uniref:Uncharacterized protein n=1 Tax=Waddlia chondrophila 2032/99 TaxID=765953 RepID=F8LCF1_9BACT|nr:putative uncharacterized protein [Waddlia chondrophila 2032/99]
MMLRQAVRKTPKKAVRKPLKRAVAKKHAKAKKALTPAAKPIFIPRIKTFVSNLGSFIDQRKKNFSTKDPIYKRLYAIHSALQRELRKNHAFNPTTAKHLKALTPALRGVANLPANVKGQVGKLAIFIRSQVNKDVQALMKHFASLFTPLHHELSQLNKTLNADIKKAKTQKIQWKIDASIKRKIGALNTHFNRYKTKWFSRLNKISLHGNAQIKTQVKALKKQIEEAQKLLRNNQTIINRYAKTPKARKGYKTQFLMNENQMKTLESKMENIETTCEKARMQVEHFWDQLKAVKLF